MQRLRLVLVAVVVALTLNTIAVAVLATDIRRAGEVSQATSQAQHAVDALYRSIVDQESAVSVYALTDDSDVLRRYEGGIAAQNARTRQLRGLLGDDPRSIAALDRVDTATQRWRQDALEQTLRSTRSGRTPADALVAGTSMRLFDAVRDDMDTLRSAVDDRVAAALADVQMTQQRTLWVLGATVIGTAALVVLGVRLTTSSLSRPLTQLVEAASAVADGHLDRQVPTSGPPEFVRLGDAVERMRVRLRSETSTAARRSLVVGQEGERRRIASGIHDDTIQAAVAASVRLQRLRRRVGDIDPDVALLVSDAEADLSAAISRLRRLVFELHPPTLDEQGLESAMRLYLQETVTPAGMRWTVRFDGPEPDEQAVRSVAYRVFREAVHNAVKHSGANRLDVAVDVGRSRCRVTVTDNGHGFDVEEGLDTEPGHLGLLSSQRLCEVVQGTWTVRSTPGLGTVVEFEVPTRLSGHARQ
ncbi:MAG TPA: CHASE3 domain-containing protein [Actinomycetales bacterium]|nr:CHASE3 domain-containing protein [Actinomycetales bacterium]